MNWKKIFTIAALTGFSASVATGQGTAPTIVQGDYISNVFGQSNFIKNPNAKLNTKDVTVSSATVTRSTTTPLVATSEFNITTSTSTGYADWATRTFDAGMKNQNCEARFTYRGFSVGSTTVQIRQGSNTVAQLTLTPSTDPRIASINFPCGDLSNATTFRIAQTTASMTGTNEIGGIYVGLATNQANVAQAELVGTWKMVGAANCAMTTATTSFDQFNADSDCNSPTVTGSVSAAQGKRPWIEINNPKPGNYYVIAKGSFYNTATNLSHFVRLTAIKSAGSESTSQLRIYGGTSTLIVPMTLSMTTTFTSGTLGFSMDGATDNTATPVSLQNDTSKTDVTFEVYRFPTSSELVVTPERQNVWGAVKFTAGNSNLFSGSAPGLTYSNYTDATNWKPTSAGGSGTYYGKATATTTTGELGLKIPNMPVGTYRMTVRGNVVPDASAGASGQYTACSMLLYETTTTSGFAQNYQFQGHGAAASVPGPGDLSAQFLMDGIYANSSVADRNFIVRAQKLYDSTTGNVGKCSAITFNGDINITVTPLDQPSNSALYVEGPVKASATGAAIPAGYQGETKTATVNSATATASSASYTYTNATNELSLETGVWHIHYFDSFYRGTLSGTNPSGFGACQIYNTTDASSISELQGAIYVSSSFDYEGSYAGNCHVSFVVNITSTKAYRGRIGTYLNSGTSVQVTTRGSGKFYAIRLN